MRLLIVLSLVVTLATESLAQAPRAPEDKSVDATGKEFITPETQARITRGLDYLAATQSDNGAFGTQHYREDVGVTALCGLAFLSAGHTPGRGKYGKVVDKALEHILNSTDASGFINADESRSHGPMYGHGFATLFLAEIYGMTDRKDVKSKLKLACNLIVNTQNKEGGWRYFAVRKDADLSVTVCQIMALRAARNVGHRGPQEHRRRLHPLREGLPELRRRVQVSAHAGDELDVPALGRGGRRALQRGRVRRP